MIHVNGNGTGTPLVEMQHISKHYGALHALHEIDMTVYAGEVVALLGANGAGKTTAISIMLGLRIPTSGQVTVFGHNPRSRQARSQCGVMLQESGIPAVLTVRELVDLFRSYYAHPLSTAAVLAMAGLADKARAKAGSLSGGQRQRLYFALAVCGDPAIIFLDEPTAALDVEARHSFWAHVRGFVERGKSVVLTTHHLEEADALAHRVIVLDHGQIVANDTPTALKRRVAGKLVRFHCASPLTQADVQGLPVQRVEITEGWVQFLTAHPENVLRALFARSVAIDDLTITSVGLEEVFFALTERTAS